MKNLLLNPYGLVALLGGMFIASLFTKWVDWMHWVNLSITVTYLFLAFSPKRDAGQLPPAKAGGLPSRTDHPA